MHKKENRAALKHSRSIENLAVVFESVVGLREGDGNIRASNVRLLQDVVQKESDESVEAEFLASVKGILNGFLFSIVIWFLIALGIILAMS